MTSAPRTIKAIFTDMDGTLLNPQHQISEFTLSVLKQLKAKGIRFILCTGRPYPDVFATIRKCGLEPDYIITSNGARIHNGDLELIRQYNMDPTIVEQIVKINHEPDNEGNLLTEEEKRQTPLQKRYISNIYRGAEWWADATRANLNAAYDPSFQCKDLGDNFKKLTADQLDDVHEMWFIGDPDSLVGLERHMHRTYGGILRCSYSLPHLLDCVPAEVTKGNAMKEVCALLDLSVEDVACFGDGQNDLPMMTIAGHAFIMSNGQEAVKAAMPTAEVIGSNAEDGVAKKLVELLL